MKTLFSALLFVCFLNASFAGVLSVEQLRNTLITNTWRETDTKEWTGFGLMMEFHDNSVATVISNTHAEWPAMARYNWSVDLQRENPVITFRDYSGLSYRYTAVQTPRGLDLLPFDAEMRPVIHLSYGNRVTTAQWSKTQQTLFGAWENTVAATNVNSQIPQLRFNSDGTYAFLIGLSNKASMERETGRWMLSKCSDFIILMPHDSDTLEYAKVRLISADEMVVEQLVVTKGSLVVNQEIKNMFFNKL
ncbi:MAG TPA: hypothetical protein PLE32_02960 [Haliscomenobacter sp.]|nr:hypothetical protein [Haliscomenobacter sp.]